MKKLAVLFMVLFCFVTTSSVVMASEEVYREETAEVTDIYEILDEIEVLDEASIAALDNEEDYRTWNQGDERWGQISLGGSAYTMKRSGCLVTSITKLIIQAELKDENEFTPKTLVTWLNKNGGFTGSGNLYWAKPAEYVDGFSYAGELVKSGTYNSNEYDDQVIEWILSGYHIVLNVKDRGHWVAVDEKQTLKTGKIHIMDSLIIH